MKWTEIAIEDLQKYRGLKASLKNISDQIGTLEMKFTGIGGFQTDRVPNSGSGGNRYEDFLIDNIDERERLKRLFQLNKKIVSIIHRGLSALNDDERLALEYFYIHPQPKHIEKLMVELEIAKSEVYRLKDRALRNYTMHMFGVLEI